MEHLLRFREILEKHGLDKDENADKIAHYLTNTDKKGFSDDDFANEFGIPVEDARIILEVIYKATEFRKNLVGEKDGK